MITTYVNKVLHTAPKHQQNKQTKIWHHLNAHLLGVANTHTHTQTHTHTYTPPTHTHTHTEYHRVSMQTESNNGMLFTLLVYGDRPFWLKAWGQFCLALLRDSPKLHKRFLAASNRRFLEITGKDNLTVFSYFRRVKSPEWRQQLRRADLQQF